MSPALWISLGVVAVCVFVIAQAQKNKSGGGN